MVISREDGKDPKKSIMTKIAIIGTASLFPWIFDTEGVLGNLNG